MTEKKRVEQGDFTAGLIGCGNIGSRYDEGQDGKGDLYTHAGMYANLDGVELTCLAECDRERLRAAGRFWGVEHLYEDHCQMLSLHDFDILSIATPDDSHEQIILDALRLGPPKLIFSEKPVANSVEAAMAIEAECRQHNVALVVDYVRRWDLNHCLLRDFLQQGGLGRVHNMTGYYVRGLRHNGCQLINLIQFLFGDITQVRALAGEGQGSMAGDPSLDLQVSLVNGESGYLMGLDRPQYCFSIFELEIFGSKGRLRLLNGGRELRFFPVEGHPDFPNFLKISDSAAPLWQQDTYGSAIIEAGRQLSAFLRGERGDLENDISVAIRDLRVIEAAGRSAESHGEIIEIAEK